MAYEGWLLKIGDYKIDTAKYVAAESYSPYVNMQDVDPWTDANGYGHRNAVVLKALSVDFETPAMLTDDDLQEFLSNIRRNFVNETEQGCYITAYIPFLGEYVTQYGYMADIKPTIYGNYNGTIKYNPISISFVGGVYNGNQ